MCWSFVLVPSFQSPSDARSADSQALPGHEEQMAGGHPVPKGNYKLITKHLLLETGPRKGVIKRRVLCD